MSKYIDKEKLFKELLKLEETGIKLDLGDILALVDRQEEANVGPKDIAYWLSLDDNWNCEIAYMKCSVCGETREWEELNYCPNCGRKMLRKAYLKFDDIVSNVLEMRNDGVISYDAYEELVKRFEKEAVTLYE